MNSPLTLAARDYSKDIGLAQRAQAGDRSAQQELFRLLRQGVHGTLYRVLGSNEHMEDLLQDAFIEIFRSLPHYRGESQLNTWADRISARVAFHYLKRKRSRSEREGTLTQVQLHLVGSPEDQAQHREGLKHLYALLRRMKPEHHVAVALFMVDGRSLEEVAEITGVSLVAAKNRVSRARRKLFEAARRDQLLASYLAEQADAAEASDGASE
jgi:RNA polymerase sigma-70 factor (ECF subfamily)